MRDRWMDGLMDGLMVGYTFGVVPGQGLGGFNVRILGLRVTISGFQG